MRKINHISVIVLLTLFMLIVNIPNVYSLFGCSDAGFPGGSNPTGCVNNYEFPCATINGITVESGGGKFGNVALRCCSGLMIPYKTPKSLGVCVSNASTFSLQGISETIITGNLIPFVGIRYLANGSKLLSSEPISKQVNEARSKATLSGTLPELDRLDIIRDLLIEKAESIWRYNYAFVLIMLELLKLIFYIIEMRLTVYVLLILIPNIFFRIRDSFVYAFIKRGVM